MESVRRNFLLREMAMLAIEAHSDLTTAEKGAGGRTTNALSDNTENYFIHITGPVQSIPSQSAIQYERRRLNGNPQTELKTHFPTPPVESEVETLVPSTTLNVRQALQDAVRTRLSLPLPTTRTLNPSYSTSFSRTPFVVKNTRTDDDLPFPFIHRRILSPRTMITFSAMAKAAGHEEPENY
eukprot:GDKJ01050025.1.p2 GENE.GDKJ01050025.1~~GDKJ01050025.1.p2  ORF type:complete len:182 (+),score=5.21 GDKJ01050025.1:807-1352(+)